MLTLTPRQAEVLGILTRAGIVHFSAQTGRVKTVIRKLIEKGAVELDGDSVKVLSASAPRHYSYANILLVAQPVEGGDGRWKKAVVTLAEGDTIYCPYSTKYAYRGAGEYVFMIHPSSMDLTSMPGNVTRAYL